MAAFRVLAGTMVVGSAMNITVGAAQKWPMMCPATLRADTDCYGADLYSLAIASKEQCCQECSVVADCNAFAYFEGMCYLKSGCDSRVSKTGVYAGILDDYIVHHDSFEIHHNYVCGDQSRKTLIFYPQGDGPFPVVVYGHGTMGGIDGAAAALKTVAGQGLIVIAPYTLGEYQKCDDEWMDMKLALSAARIGGGSLHMALGNAEWSRSGVWGYSMGGKRASRVVYEDTSNNVHAMYCSHGARNVTSVDVPSFYTTGTADPIEGPSIIRPRFDKSEARPKIYVNLIGASHTEPQEGGRLNVWGGRFLSCHLARRDRQCHRMYGSGPGTLCDSGLPLADCVRVRSDQAEQVLV